MLIEVGKWHSLLVLLLVWWSTCLCVCVCVCVCVCAYMLLCVFLCVCVLCVHVLVSVWEGGGGAACICVYLYVYVYVCAWCVCVFVCVCVCVFMCTSVFLGGGRGIGGMVVTEHMHSVNVQDVAAWHVRATMLFVVLHSGLQCFQKFAKRAIELYFRTKCDWEIGTETQKYWKKYFSLPVENCVCHLTLTTTKTCWCPV